MSVSSPAYPILCLFLALQFSSTHCEKLFGQPEEKDIVILTEKTFQSFIEKNHHVLVIFYADWSEPCKNALVTFSEAATELRDREHPVPLAKVNSMTNPKLIEKYKISHYPAMKYFLDGEPLDFHHGHKTEDIVKYVDRKNGSPSTEIKTLSELDSIKEDHQVVVGFFSDNPFQLKTFQQTARKFDDLVFVHSSEKKFLTAFSPVTIFKHFDEEPAFLSTAFTEDQLFDFVHEHRYPAVMEFDGDNAIDRIFIQKTPALVLFTDEVSGVVYVLEKAAEELKGKVAVMTATISRGLGKNLANFVGLRHVEDGSVWLIHPLENGKAHKYKFEGDRLDVGSLVDFVTKFEDEELERHTKSEEIDTNAENQKVKKVVGESFKRIVYDHENHVLLYVHSHWCHPCKKLAPVVEQLAEKLSYIDDLVFAQMDGQKNEVEELHVDRYPKLLLFKMDGKTNPFEYIHGDYTEKEVLDWLSLAMGPDWIDMEKDL